MADVYEAAQYVALGPAPASHDKSATGGPGKNVMRLVQSFRNSCKICCRQHVDWFHSSIQLSPRWLLRAGL